MILLDKALLDDKTFQKRLEKEKERNIIRERKAQLAEERNKYRSQAKKPTTSKLLLAAAFLISIEILIFCEAVYFLYPDPGILITLIGVPVTIVPIALGYLRKSTAENTVGGIVYDSAMADYNSSSGIGD